MFHFEIGRAADSWGVKSLGSGGGCPPTDSILIIEETTTTPGRGAKQGVCLCRKGC